MKKIINPWRNHPEYNCFGCCPDNPIGLHLEFYEDGDYIVSKWHPEHNYQGWVNTMHGGILSTLIDEVCGWVVTRKMQTSGYTFQLNVKFKKAIPTTEPELTIRAKVSKQVRNLVYINAEITNSKGELCNEGEAIYFLMKYRLIYFIIHLRLHNVGIPFPWLSPDSSGNRWPRPHYRVRPSSW